MSDVPTPGPAVLYEVASRIARITIDRPEAREPREAERPGLVSHAVPAADRAAKLDERAGRRASLSPAVLRLGCDASYAVADMEFSQALDGLQSVLTVNLGTEDAIEGVHALLQKREPEWKGE